MIWGYPHLWKPPYIYIYIFHAAHALYIILFEKKTIYGGGDSINNGSCIDDSMIYDDLPLQNGDFP